MLTPLVLRLATASGGVDRPTSHRKRQLRAIPRFGGIVIFGAVLISAALSNIRPSGELGVILFGGSVAVLSGVIDDVRNCRPITKIIFQLVCATCGTAKAVFSGMISSNAPSVAVTLFLTVALMNAYNFVDGVDGLCPALSIFALFVLLALKPSTVAAMLIFAILGFLPYNYPSAKIYLGESGAALLGFAIAQLTAARINSHGITPLFASAIPIAELVGTVLRRCFSKKSIASADRYHLHHLILDSGAPAPLLPPIFLALSLALVLPLLV